MNTTKEKGCVWPVEESHTSVVSMAGKSTAVKIVVISVNQNQNANMVGGGGGVNTVVISKKGVHMESNHLDAFSVVEPLNSANANTVNRNMYAKIVMESGIALLKVVKQ